MRFAIAAAAVLTANAAAAATITDSDSFGPAITEIATPGSVNPLGTPVNADALELDLFDGSLGTLTGVMVTLTGAFESTGTVINSSSGPVTAQAEETVTFFANSSVFGDVDFGASDDTGFQSFAPGVAGTVVDLAGSEMVMLNPTNFADFTGAAGDTFLIDFNTIVATGFTGGGGNLDFLVDTTAEISAEVKYTFDAAPTPVAPIPLPAAGWMLLAGLGGIGLLGRRRA